MTFQTPAIWNAERSQPRLLSRRLMDRSHLFRTGFCRPPSVDAMDRGGVVAVDPDVGTASVLKGVDGIIDSG